MPLGPGRYDDLCRETAAAEGAILLIFGGKKGDGFSCQAPLALPKFLRELADQIEETNRKGEV